MSTNWELMVHYINSHENGAIITRKDLLSYCNFPSVDVYRQMLSRIGFLSKTDGSGGYVKLLSIPNSLSVNKAQSVIKSGSNIKMYWRSLKIEEIFLNS